MSKSEEVTLLIDADIFAFESAAVCEGVYYFTPGEEPSVAENLEDALRKVDNDIEAVASKLKATRIIVCLTDAENFRYEVYPDYKGNRRGVRKPSTLKAVKQHLADNYETYQRPKLEADDCMGILSTHPKLISGKRVIVSTDKDMQTIPGYLFNPGKDKEIRQITEVEANRFFMTQVITGDSTDGYPGVKGVGPKSLYVKAVAEETTAKAMWGHVVDAYKSKGQTEKDAIVQARCARILRHSDFNYSDKTVRLWCPPV